MSVSSLPAGAGIALDRVTEPHILKKPITGTGKAGPIDLTAEAQKFETMTIAQLLKPMFATMGKADPPFGGGAIERSFRPFLLDAIAKAMEARGGLGLAPMIETALAANRSSDNPSAASRGTAATSASSASDHSAGTIS